MKITQTALVLLIQTLQCLALDDSPFQLTNKDTGFCLVKTNNQCSDIRWTTGDRLLVQQRKKCLGVQGKSVGSEVSLYDCDENSDLQKWECKNGTVLVLKDQALYIELTHDSTAVLSKTIGPNNHLTIPGTPNGACARTYRELYAIGGNAAGLLCMFPFHYKDQWFSDCTTLDSSENNLWCAVETKYQSERWGYCPVTSKDGWTKHPTTGAYYQLNTQAALTWAQADASCKQQGASLLSITDPHEQAYITALLDNGGNKLWTGLILDPEHGWRWSNGRPYRYLKWAPGHPLPNPGHNCAIVDPAVQYSWQSTLCSKTLGYICYSKEAEVLPTQAVETGLCSSPWIPYSGHCFYLNRTQNTWADAQRACRNDRANLVSMRNVEDQSFVISQLGYTSTDELWIGLNDIKTEGLFDWSDHSTVSFTSWAFGKPAVSTDLKDCVLIRGENGNWADHVCEEKHGYICMKKSATESTGGEMKQDLGCKSGWRRYGSYCYFVATQTKTFDEAKDDCKSSDSYLADVSNGLDNAFLVSLVGMRPEKYFWLGLSNQVNIYRFMWTNKDSVRFTHWNTEMPGHQQGCVAMNTGIFAGLWDVLPCTNKEKYICKHLAEGAVLTPAPPTPAPTTCATSWTQIGSRNYCYKVFGTSSHTSSSSERRTWYDARDYCRAIGGDLLSIHSSEELKSLPRRYEVVWIGLSAPDPVTGYVWSDGSPLQFQHWEDGKPDNKNNVEFCAVYKMENRDASGSWNDMHCERFLGWLCQIRLGLTPKRPPGPVALDYNKTSDGWLEWKGSQYYFNRDSMAMEDARRFCQQRHGDLVTVNSQAESVFLWKQVSSTWADYYWIGLNVDLDETYGWMDGSPVVFQRWDENQPKFVHNDENCAALTTSLGFWHNRNCGYEHRSICKRSESPPANATVAPTVPPKGGCPQNWKKFNSKCYSIINSQRETWFGARTQCKSMGGNLASILSRHEQVFLTIQLAETATTDLWIGMYGNPPIWTDGRPRAYTNWGKEKQKPYRYYDSEDYDYYHRPSSNEKCAVMTTDPHRGIGKWIKTSCNDTNGYVCLRNVDPTLPDSPEPTTADYVKIFNDSIKVVTQQMTWEAAKMHCESDGAKLASLRNEWTDVYAELMALNLKVPLWIGLNKKETGGYFIYIDGWHITSPSWDQNEPSSNRDCVFVNTDGKWETADCNKNMSSICMKSTDVPPTQSSEFPGFCPNNADTGKQLSHQNDGWLPFRAYCYLFVTKKSEWTHASSDCAKHGGNLASIEDPSEQEFIERNIKIFENSHTSFWMGLYKTHKGKWQWLDKIALDYTNWREDQPDINSFGLIKVIDGKWFTSDQRLDRGYVCKTPKVLGQVPKATVNPTMDPQTHGHIILAVVLVITAIAIGTVITLFLFKKSGHRLLIPGKSSTFDNPLFFTNERAKPGPVDTNKLVANAEEEDPVPVTTV
ncbi:macrophage mannose receptor 1-like isoform X1 [Epinephelus fuscoguttatus]|uniref:macrophage mannose receptor 1-like isoform X1 n=1 Tax=Epinephelus fuscoguttatus TaxID=293821 RepID=UPI0020D1C1AA|nr:macrophage mannose receptor 1-like isoform X1 [Epinephelus fuscoguttatus]